MFWLSQGGGPWGGGPRGGGPWGGGPRNMAAARARAGAGRSRPISRNCCGAARTGFGGCCRAGLAPAPASPSSSSPSSCIWLASGFYRVLPDEVGVVLRFGAYNRTTQPGLNYHLPSPIESGADAERHPGQPHRDRLSHRRGRDAAQAATRQVPEEALMLTGDENIVDINFTVFWVIKDAKAYLFNIRDPEADGQIGGRERDARGHRRNPDRSGAGRRAGQDRDRHANSCCSRSSIATAPASRSPSCSCSGSIRRPKSSTSFRDVQAALADRARLRNEAESYRNDIIPGRAAMRCRSSSRPKPIAPAIIARSQGDADRFLSVYHAFKAAQDVTVERLYLETMEQVLKNSNKVIIDKSAQGRNGVLPYLPLPALGGGSCPAPRRPGGTAESRHPAAVRRTSAIGDTRPAGCAAASNERRRR